MTTAGAPGPTPPTSEPVPVTATFPAPDPLPPAATSPTLPAPTPAPPALSPYLVAAGHLAIVGKQPDGDSVRFRPQNPDVLRDLAHGERVEFSADGSVQLRLDGVDAPELHYAGHRQPFGDRSRDAFVGMLGFTGVAFAANHMTVTAAEPTHVPAVIVARMAEVHGRPVAFLFTGDDAAELAGRDGGRLDLDVELLTRSANLRMIRSGDVYPLLYSSTPPGLREAVVATASDARTAGLGVYAADATARFGVADHTSLGPGGDLVFPKLFRRVTEWLRDTRTAAAHEAAVPPAPGTFPAWLRANPGRNDRVLVAGARRSQALHALLGQTGQVVTMAADPLSLVFVER